MKTFPRWLPFAVILAFWPVWRWYVLRMSDGSDEPWGIAALGLASWFLWKTRGEIRLTPGGVMAAGSLALVYVLGFSLFPSLIRALIALLVIAFLTGTLRKHPAIWGLFVLSLPIVASLQFYLGYPLRIITAIMANGALNLVGVDVTRQSTELIWQGQTIGVDAPCSGIQMLWVGLFLTMALCAAYRLNWARTLACGSVGFLLIVLGNGLRATLLFVKESGMLELPEWTHAGIGMVIFAGLVFGLMALTRKVAEGMAEEGLSGGPISLNRWRSSFTGGVLFLSAVSPFFQDFSIAQHANASFPGWPDTWEGHYLEPMPLTEQEAAFAEKFPGKIAVFAAGPNKIILRWITQPTRKLHSSADCLRAAGWEITTERPGKFLAQSGSRQFLVEEEITVGAQRWKEVSAWFWAATFRKTEGPWWATTAIQPLSH